MKPLPIRRKISQDKQCALVWLDIGSSIQSPRLCCCLLCGHAGAAAAAPTPAAHGDLTAAQTSAAAALVGGSARLSPAGEWL
jgi:hypothetical protein